MSLISTVTPLPAAGNYISSVHVLTRATKIVGSAYADVPGICYIDQSGDGTNFDIIQSYEVPANTGVAIETDVLSQNLRVRFINGNTAQATFRLYVDILDPYGAFLAAASAPSPGGAWMVLYQNPGNSTYQVVGRFDATDGWNANGNAAIATNTGGQYASVPVANFTVSNETLQKTTQHAIASF